MCRNDQYQLLSYKESAPFSFEMPPADINPENVFSHEVCEAGSITEFTAGGDQTSGVQGTMVHSLEYFKNMDQKKLRVMSNLVDDLSKLFDNPERVIFCAYLNLGFICLDVSDGSKLVLVSTLDGGSGSVLFGKISTINLCPVLPSTAEFQQIVPNKSGSKLALIGLRMVVIVDMNDRFWMSASLLSPGDVSHLQSEYFSRCQILHMSLVVSKNPPSVIKVRWLTTSTSFYDSSVSRRNVLGVLFSDNIIRVYDVKESTDRALFTFDFNNILPSGSDQGESVLTDGHGFGLFSQLVSFDFGPLMSSNNWQVSSIFALDSDGEIYFTSFSWRDMKAFDPCGPLSVSKSRLNEKFLCAACDIIFVQHKLSSSVPVLALSSSEGVISHAVLVQRDTLKSLITNGHNIFDIYIFDSVQLLSSSASSIGVKLQNDLSERAAYLAWDASNVYMVDITPWATDLYVQMTNESEQPSTKSTSLHHVLMFVDANTCNKENNKDVSTARLVGKNPTFSYIRTAATLPLYERACEAQNETRAKQDDCTDRMMLFLALTDQGNSITSIVRRRLATRDYQETPRQAKTVAYGPHVSEKIQARIVRGGAVPNIKFNNLTRQEELRVSQGVIETLIKNTRNLEPGIDVAIDEARNIISGFEGIENSRKALNAKLEQIFNEITNSKSKVATQKRSFKISQDRIRRIAVALQPIMFPVDDNEEIYETLQKWQTKIREYHDQLSDTNLRVASYRTRLLGPSKPFRASAPAQKFILSKNDVELNQLKNSIERMMKEIDIGE
ncbi:nuclear pore component domain-containing protein [Ditylenchus destructor]|uniref:Nuclear pore component domain-containing protein n=1 Tax=Ditylenchus destructor TaxID=166010 RepID=A0AAD4NJ74_9BILA|nr:nuclear pore component domain-containing protein [Ditylenchus destructor]